jgi:hypothetical protein
MHHLQVVVDALPPPPLPHRNHAAIHTPLSSRISLGTLLIPGNPSGYVNISSPLAALAANGARIEDVVGAILAT